MRRLRHAGFKNDFVRSAILPEWWDEECAGDATLLPEVEIRVARFLGSPIASIRNPDANLAAPLYAGARLRRIRDVEADRLGTRMPWCVCLRGLL